MASPGSISSSSTAHMRNPPRQDRRRPRKEAASGLSKKSRRSFLKQGMAVGSAAAGIALLGPSSPVFGESDFEESSSHLRRGDAALLRFAVAAETLESDFWIQYNELGGIPDSEVPGGSGSPGYIEKLEVLDEDFPQYIHDNTDDEITHFTFLNAYLLAKG